MQLALHFFSVLALCLLHAGSARRVIRAAPDEETTGNYIVVMKENTTHSRFEAIADEVRKESSNLNISEKVESPIAKIVAAKLTEDGAHKIKLLEDVEFVEEETYARGSLSWAIDRIDQVGSTLNGVFSPCGTGLGVDIYILDSGINYDHCDFGNRAKYPGFDPVDTYDRTNLRGADCHGHGSHTASLAAGTTYGVAKNATVYSVRVLRCNNAAPWSVIIDGLARTVTHIQSQNPRRPAIISMSLGGSRSTATETAVTNAINQNIPVVAAAGNSRSDACQSTPAGNPRVITVAGSWSNDRVYYWTSGGSCVDIFAPGQSVRGAVHECNSCTESCSTVLSGTSMATPIVSGAAALLLQKNSSLTPAQIKNKLIANSIKDALSYSSLEFTLHSTTPNRLLKVDYCDPICSNATVTTTKTFTSIPPAVTVTSLPPATTVTSILPAATVTDRITLTSIVLSQSTRTITTHATSTITNLIQQTSTVHITHTQTSNFTKTISITTTPTPTDVCCQTLRNFENLEKNIMNNVSFIVDNGIKHIGDLIRGNSTVTNVQAPKTTSHTTTKSTSTTLLPAPSSIAVASCADLLQYNVKSGYYQIQTNGGSKTVYCELEKDIRNNRGFARIANVNMSVPGTECPGDLSLRVDGGLRTCQRGQSSGGCTSAYFSSTGMEYSLVCGRVRGYQWASPNAFFWYTHPSSTARTIDGAFVDGVVLTYQNSTGSREHVWTFASAIDEIGRESSFACQCTNKDFTIPNFETPPFVGEDYFCETGSRNTFKYNTLYTSDPLWDGAGCGEVNTCCERGEWFCKDVPKTTSDIELRLCGNENRSNEDTPLEIIELYVK